MVNFFTPFSTTSMQLGEILFAREAACKYWRPFSFSLGKDDITCDASESFATRRGKNTLSAATKHNEGRLPCNCKK